MGRTMRICLATTGLAASVVLAGCSSGGAQASAGGTTGSTAPQAPASSPMPTPALTPTPDGSGPVLITHGFGGGVGFDGTKPSTIAFSRDSSNVVTHLSWSAWGPATAVGHGTLTRSNCLPSCAQGTSTSVPAVIRLSQVVDGHFAAMTEDAGSLSRSYSYPSNWAASAS